MVDDLNGFGSSFLPVSVSIAMGLLSTLPLKASRNSCPRIMDNSTGHISRVF